MLVTEICAESGLLDPNGCGKTLRVGGGEFEQKAQLPACNNNHIGAVVTNYATRLNRFTDIARDYKGFGRQGMTAIIEISKEGEND